MGEAYEAKVAAMKANDVIVDKMRELPDIAAYEERRRKRLQKPGVEKRVIARRKTKAKVVKSLRHKVTLAMMRGIKGRGKIADAIGVSPTLVKAVVEDKGFDAHITHYQDAVLENAYLKLRAKLDEATDKLASLLHCKNAAQRIQLDAAREIMNRVNFIPQTVTHTVSRNYTNDELQSMTIVAREVESIARRLAASQSPYVIQKAIEDQPKASGAAALPSSQP